MLTTDVFLLVQPAMVDEMEWLLILLSLVSIGEAGGLSYNDAAAEDVDEVTAPAAFVRPSFAHQNSASMFGGQIVSPLHPNAAGAVTSSTSSAAASLYDKPPASPMDTSDNNISSHSISSTIAGCTSRNTSVVNIVHTSTPNKSPGSSTHIKIRSPASQQQATPKSATVVSQQQQQNNVNKNIMSDTRAPGRNSDGSNVTSTSSNPSSS
jgi:hypothetical protein